ncbi:DEAD/DEAH box helicase family protein, partial [Intestinibacter sp.]
MKGNFDFLKEKEEFKSFSNACIEAEKSLLVSPATTAILCRRALELGVRWVYTFDKDLKLPYRDNLSSLVHENSFKYLIDSEMFYFIKYIIKTGNLSVHTNKKVTREEAVISLRNLHQFVSWIDYCYADEYTAPEFDESLLQEGEDKRTRPQELKDLYEKLSSKDKKIEEVIKENENLRNELTNKRVQNTKNYDFKIDKISESETRKRFIDVELKLAGWEFNKDIVEEEKVIGMPNDSGVGYADYVLYGDNGKPLAVIEAKKASVEPNIGQNQAKLYADCLEKKYNQRPIIFTTNGFEIYMWDDGAGYPIRGVSGFFKKDELQLRIDRRRTRKPFDFTTIKDEITNRYYQKEAIISVCEAFDNKQRKCLIVAGTGTGKTRISVSLVDILTRHNFAKNILFLADRKELVKQAKNSFSKLLPDLPLYNLLDKNEDPESARMIFSTYPTMVNAIDETKSKDGKRLFTPGHFDLIIIDESHRSIYRKYKTIFDYFDANLLGLTATPKDEIDKNTYTIFDLENGVPTYAYEYEKAVEDQYLVDYRTIEVTTSIMENGIKY